MLNYKTVAICLLGFLAIACSKKASNPYISPSISFIYADNEQPGGTSLSVAGGSFTSQYGGNDSYDTTHGYVFFVTGPSGSNKVLSFEISALISGTYSYAAFSTAWPHSLHFDSWVFVKGTYLDPVDATITVVFTRNSNNTVDGTFSLHFANGTDYLTITEGSFLNVPVK